MPITYLFNVKEAELKYEIDIDRVFEPKKERIEVQDWQKLEFNQCENCPLSRIECLYCPVAIDLQQVVDDFKQIPADEQATVEVITPERSYSKQVPVEVGLRSMMGLIMATSACPILQKLKPNARHHLPFATQDEFILRSTAFYLMRQYFIYREGQHPDWELMGLIRLNQQLQTVNQALWKRLENVCSGDSNLQALLNFFNLSSSVSFSLESQLQAIKPLIMNENEGLAIDIDNPSKLY